jgi:hypothetical protein
MKNYWQKFCKTNYDLNIKNKITFKQFKEYQKIYLNFDTKGFKKF